MNVEIRYYTQTGNSKKLADAIAAELGSEAKSIEQPLSAKADVLFLCNSVYWAGIDNHIKQYLKKNADQIGLLVNVSTAALIESTYNQMKSLASDTGIALSSDEFHCRGKFAMLHSGHPDEKDLNEVRIFAKKLCEKLEG